MKISASIDQAHGKNSGFDYLRLVLSASVISFHSILFCYGPAAQRDFDNSTGGIAFGLVLPMFFALSGFLVAGSLERSPNIAVYLGLRAFRIIPALTAVTVACALVLGPFYTQLSLQRYFSDPLFYTYFLNIVGDLRLYLPGVFVGNPTNEVNGQLWTISLELGCYVGLALVGLVRLNNNRKVLLIGFLIVMAVLEIHLLKDGGTAWRNLPLCFCAGVLIFLFREKISLRRSYFVAALALSCGILAVPAAGYLLPFPVAYTTVFLGLLNPRKGAFMRSGDYSYGLYLCGFPLQQAVFTTMSFARTWYGNILVGFPVAFLFAFLSWHLLEKQVLRRKNLLYQMFRFKRTVGLSARA